MDAANLKQMKLQLENEETEFRRMDELYKVGGASKSEWDAAKTTLDVRRTSYNNLLENTQLLSPINGVVTARNFDNGDLYSSASTPVLVIEQITPVKLLINVSEPYFPKVTKGMTVKVKFDVYGDEEFEGKVSLVYPTIDATTHTFPVEVKLANTHQRIRPGMFGRVTVSFGTLRHVVVPDQAIGFKCYKSGTFRMFRHIQKIYILIVYNKKQQDIRTIIFHFLNTVCFFIC